VSNIVAEPIAVSIIKRFLDAWATQDIKTVLEIFSENAVYKASQGSEPGITYIGRDQISAAVQVMFKGAANTILRVVDIYPFDGGATVTWQVGGTDSSDEEVNVLGIDVFCVKDGYITLKDAYRKVKA
jgi:ketosteroid isomerase-like protein